MEDARLARAVGDTQNTPTTTDKGDTHAVVGAGQDSTDNTHAGFRVLFAMDYCDQKLLCTLGSHTVRLIAATGKKSTDETTAAGDLDGTNVLAVALVGDNWKPGCTWVHHKEGNFEDPW